MKKLIVLFMLLPLFALFSQTLDEVLQKYYKAVNQEKLSKVQTVIIKAKLIQGGAEIPMTIYQKRPHKVRSEGTFSGMTFVQTYDGTTGWNLNPFMGATEPQPLKDSELKEAASQADIDGYLVNFKEKGYKLELLPVEETLHPVKITLPDSLVIMQYLDKNSGYLVRQKIIKDATEVEVQFSDFKTVNELLVPFKMETKANGQTMMNIVVEDVKFDQDIPDTMFGKPEKTK